MTRVPFIALLLATAACGSETPPVESTAASAQLFRGAGGEVRLRCGSESLRARLRQGQVLAQVGSGESAVLVPVDDPRAKSGPAFSDGRLTLYKLPEAQAWTLARGSAAAPCTQETAP
jgi:hypothetical protein